MSNDTMNPSEIGQQLAREGFDAVSEKLDAYSGHKQREIELTNRPSLLALEAEGQLLLKEKPELEAQLRNLPPVHLDYMTRRWKTIYYGTTALVLWATGSLSTWIALQPYSLGPAAIAIAVGLAVASPFLVDLALDHWNLEKVFKYLATGAAIAALVSLMCFAVIRGLLLGQQLENDSSTAVVIDDNQSAASPVPENHFYRDSTPYLVFAMLMAAFAIETGAGLALHEAWRMRASGCDREAIQNRLAEIHSRLVMLTAQIEELRVAPERFDATLQANFYFAMLTHTARKVLSKGIVLAGLVALALGSRARAQDRLSVVVALDLTKSEDVPTPTQKTEFQENVAAVTRLLAQVPSGSRVTVIGIIHKTFTQPYLLLSATIPENPGFFGEQLRVAHQRLAQAWLARSRQLQPTFQSSDILGLFSLAAQIFDDDKGSRRKMLVIFSDMRQHTPELDLETSVSSFDRVRQQLIIPNLAGVDVYALGVDGVGKSTNDWNALQAFWQDYLRIAKANSHSYSALRDVPIPW